MKKFVALTALLCVPGLTFAGGYYTPHTPQKTTQVSPPSVEVPVVEILDDDPQYTPVYEPVFVPATPVNDVELAPTVDEETSKNWYTPQTMESETTSYPWWWGKTYNRYVEPTDRQANDSLGIYQDKQTKAQEKLLKYRTYMR